ncbi:hypothetical protein ACOI1H_07075 [Loktanella sp. DJP18]|uniref:hypothetical protein n=1 Tax=Loktanella sp. DJP18 TaxID=3409788 RepID=UPI003BB4BAF7
MKLVDCFAQFGGDALDSFDGVDLLQLHDQVAWRKIAAANTNWPRNWTEFQVPGSCPIPIPIPIPRPSVGSLDLTRQLCHRHGAEGGPRKL